MGLRATSVKKYEIEYGEHQGFNHNSEGLYEIISYFCEDFFYGENGVSTEVVWEIEKGEFKRMIDAIKGLNSEEYEELVGINCEYSKDEIVPILNGFVLDTPADSDYVHIGWL